MTVTGKPQPGKPQPGKPQPGKPQPGKPQPRKPLTRDDLAPLARAATGAHRTLTGVARLRGGSKKGVYRLTFDDDTTAVAYVWSADEDYWDAGPSDPRDPFSHGTGLDLLIAAHDRLTAVGVRTPRLLYADATHAHLPADAAVMEDVTGGSLEDLLDRDPHAAPAALEGMTALLDALHACTGPRFGKVAVIDNGGSSYGSSCEQRVLEGALRDLEEVTAREPRAAAARAELEGTLRALAAQVRPRTEPPTLIHGELGADHVLVTADGDLALIDGGAPCCTSTSSGSTSSCANASSSTTPPCAPGAAPTSTNTVCASTDSRCTSPWSPARCASSTSATSTTPLSCVPSRSTAWAGSWSWSGWSGERAAKARNRRGKHPVSQTSYALCLEGRVCWLWAGCERPTVHFSSTVNHHL
ncbi:phosphotransferase [Streptomyces sp. NL15-2K]|uniref:phosphotransferase family protein n=1 Tax=Streptomyces sp. NL15-2K TaxID=376149 RepID=UPI000FFB0361|nr:MULTISPECIES: phosphotransferase [Actinomycetes]WKX12310.1 phosphotransferase [Kutzneria buriramensis]GCB46189.1 hypothetical protein SNL152K_3487 [Streptomyces sp. NL15-2K]